MAASAPTTPASDWQFSAGPASDLEPYFLASADPDSGFLGGDTATSILWQSVQESNQVTSSSSVGVSSVPSSAGKLATAQDKYHAIWLYSDTLVGRILPDSSRQIDRMPRNSLGIMELKQASNSSSQTAAKSGHPSNLQPAGTPMPHFFPKTDTKDTHVGIFSPGDKSNWLWLTGGGIQVGSKLYVIAGEFHQYSEGQWGWGQCGTNCLVVDVDLSKDPLTWPVSSTSILPACFNGDMRDRWTFASSITYGGDDDEEDGFIYLTGQLSESSQKYAFLTRITRESFVAQQWESLQLLTKVDDAGAPQWTPFKELQAADAPNAAHRLFNDAPSETTVEWHPFLKRWTVLTANSFISPDALLRTAPNLWGPWSANTPIYRMPEGNDSNVFCYSPKSHSEFAAADEIVFSYMCNGSWECLQKNAGVYIPKMVRVKIQPASKLIH